jgi:Dolichyl-phosphate-mannose-protein mannosyltransferase
MIKSTYLKKTGIHHTGVTNMDQTLNWLKSKIKLNYIWWLIIFAGIVLRLRQYLLDFSLSTEEAALALNIVTRTFSGLTQPLNFEVGGPIAFLFIEKLFFIVLGTNDFVPRIFPFLSGLLAIYLFYSIAREHFGVAGLFAFTAFAISPSMTYYTSYLRPYSSDVTVALLLFYLSDFCISEKVRARDFLLFGIAGIVAIWISNPSVFILAGIGLVVAIQKWLQKDYVHFGWSVIMGCIWIVTFGIYYILSLRHLVADSYLHGYWLSTFMPFPPWKNPKWFLDTYLSLLSISLNRTEWIFALACFLLILIGSVSLLARKRTVAFVMILPFVMVLVASALQKYPFDSKFVLFLVPFIYLFMAEGLSRLYWSLANWNRILALVIYGAIFLMLLKPAAGNATRTFLYPSRSWDMRPVMQYIVKNRKADDTFYVSGGGQIFNYYAEIYGLNTNNVILRNSHRVVGRWTFENDLKSLAGKNRVWVIFTYFEAPNIQSYIRDIHQDATITDTFQSWDARAYLINVYP